MSPADHIWTVSGLPRVWQFQKLEINKIAYEQTFRGCWKEECCRGGGNIEALHAGDFGVQGRTGKYFFFNYLLLFDMFFNNKQIKNTSVPGLLVTCTHSFHYLSVCERRLLFCLSLVWWYRQWNISYLTIFAAEYYLIEIHLVQHYGHAQKI